MMTRTISRRLKTAVDRTRPWAQVTAWKNGLVTLCSESEEKAIQVRHMILDADVVDPGTVQIDTALLAKSLRKTDEPVWLSDSGIVRIGTKTVNVAISQDEEFFYRDFGPPILNAWGASYVPDMMRFLVKHVRDCSSQRSALTRIFLRVNKDSNPTFEATDGHTLVRQRTYGGIYDDEFTRFIPAEFATLVVRWTRLKSWKMTGFSKVDDGVGALLVSDNAETEIFGYDSANLEWPETSDIPNKPAEWSEQIHVQAGEFRDALTELLPFTAKYNSPVILSVTHENGFEIRTGSASVNVPAIFDGKIRERIFDAKKILRSIDGVDHTISILFPQSDDEQNKLWLVCGLENRDIVVMGLSDHYKPY